MSIKQQKKISLTALQFCNVNNIENNNNIYFNLHSEEYAVFYTFYYFIQCSISYLFALLYFCPIACNVSYLITVYLCTVSFFYAG